MPATVNKKDYILLYEDLSKYNMDLRAYEDLQSTMKALSVELETLFRRPLKSELEEMVRSKNVSLAVEQFIVNYYNTNGSPITLSFRKVVELMELDLTKIHQLVSSIEGRQHLVFKKPQKENYRYYARTETQIERYKKLTKVIEALESLYDDNTNSLTNGFLARFAVGSSNLLTTNGRTLAVNYKWILNT